MHLTYRHLFSFGRIIGAVLIMLGLYSVLWGKKKENGEANKGESLAKPLLDEENTDKEGSEVISDIP